MGNGLESIGTIDSPYANRRDCPANGWSDDTVSEMHIHQKFQPGLYGLEEGMEIHVLWWFHRARRDVLRQKYEEDSEEVGVFSMRSPERPNPIALSLCKIVDIDGRVVSVVGLEAVDGSKILDIKKAVKFEGRIL